MVLSRLCFTDMSVLNAMNSKHAAQMQSMLRCKHDALHAKHVDITTESTATKTGSIVIHFQAWKYLLVCSVSWTNFSQSLKAKKDCWEGHKNITAIQYSHLVVDVLSMGGALVQSFMKEH